MTSPLIGALAEGPLDIVGDVHGEIDALDELLAALGYSSDGQHPQARRLVFAGDLVDRGPDSPAVLERVLGMVAAGRAQCVLGNHELNLLRDVEKHGNGWWVAPDKPMEYPARPLAPADKPRYKAFLQTLPLILERPDLRVVHACWHPDAVASIRAADGEGTGALDLFTNFQARLPPRCHRHSRFGESDGKPGSCADLRCGAAGTEAAVGRRSLADGRARNLVGPLRQ